MKFRIIVITIILIVTVAAASQAAPLNQTFQNDYSTDYIYLFITAGDVDFVEWKKLPGGWDVDIDEEKKLSAYGPEINPGERFRVRFSERGTFTLEWAEMLGGVEQQKGSIYYENGRFIGADNNFTAAIPSVPISGTYWLLGSGLIVLIGVRRRYKSPYY